MEQSDLAQFRFYEANLDTGDPGLLFCGFCNFHVKGYSEYSLGMVPNLLELMEDAAAHWAKQHRDLDET